MSRITIKDVAKRAGVSLMTVSNALNGKTGVSEETRMKIVAIAREMNYHPNLIAKSLRTDETKTIGVITSNSSEIVTSTVLSGIEDGAFDNGYSIIIANTDHIANRERSSISNLISKQIDGLILVAPVLFSKTDIEAIQSYGLPFVFLMRRNDNADVDTVVNDNYKGGYLTVKHLVQEGCDAFQIISIMNSPSSIERENGYIQAFHDLKIPDSAYSIASSPANIDASYKLVSSLLKGKKHFNALICGCDTIAIGAMDAVLNNNLRIPEDICLIGYDGVYLDRYLRVPLSTIEQPLYQIGKTGFGILLNRIRYPDMAIRKIVLDSKLISRESTNLRNKK